MAEYTQKIRKGFGNIVVSAAALLPGGGLAQQEAPDPVPEGLAGEIMNAQRCGTRGDIKDGMLYCLTNHASLKMLTGYLKDLEANTGSDKMPETIAVLFPLARGVNEIRTFETAKLKALVSELDKSKVDRNYPVVFAIRLPSPMLAMGDSEKTSGIIFIEPSVLDSVPPEAIAQAVKTHIEEIKKKQRPNDRYV